MRPEEDMDGEAELPSTLGRKSKRCKTENLKQRSELEQSINIDNQQSQILNRLQEEIDGVSRRVDLTEASIDQHIRTRQERLSTAEDPISGLSTCLAVSSGQLKNLSLLIAEHGRKFDTLSDALVREEQISREPPQIQDIEEIAHDLAENQQLSNSDEPEELDVVSKDLEAERKEFREKYTELVQRLHFLEDGSASKADLFNRCDMIIKTMTTIMNTASAHKGEVNSLAMLMGELARRMDIVQANIPAITLIGQALKKTEDFDELADRMHKMEKQAETKDRVQKQAIQTKSRQIQDCNKLIDGIFKSQSIYFKATEKLQNQMSESISERGGLRKQVQALQSKLNSETGMLKARVDLQHMQINSLQTKLKESEEQNDHLGSQYQNCCDKIEALQEELKLKDKDVKTLQVQMISTCDALKILCTQLLPLTQARTQGEVCIYDTVPKE